MLWRSSFLCCRNALASSSLALVGVVFLSSVTVSISFTRALYHSRDTYPRVDIYVQGERREVTVSHLQLLGVRHGSVERRADTVATMQLGSHQSRDWCSLSSSVMLSVSLLRALSACRICSTVRTEKCVTPVTPMGVRSEWPFIYSLPNWL